MIKKLVLSFPVDATDRSLTYDLVKRYDIRINILKAEIEAGKSGKLLVELEAEEEQLEKGITYLEFRRVLFRSKGLPIWRKTALR